MNNWHLLLEISSRWFLSFLVGLWNGGILPLWRPAQLLSVPFVWLLGSYDLFLALVLDAQILVVRNCFLAGRPCHVLARVLYLVELSSLRFFARCFLACPWLIGFLVIFVFIWRFWTFPYRSLLGWLSVWHFEGFITWACLLRFLNDILRFSFVGAHIVEIMNLCWLARRSNFSSNRHLVWERCWLLFR